MLFPKKILALFLILALNWSLLFTIRDTFAYFNDIEQADAQLTAGVLDLALSGDSGFAVPVIPSRPSIRQIDILNNGTLPFNYSFKLSNLSGDEELYDEFDLKILLDGAEIYSGPFALFSSATSVSALATSTSAHLELLVSLASEELGLWEKTCSFDLDFSAWQDNLADSDQGFFDTEIIGNTINSGVWGVVLNEFLPNPNGEEYGFDFGDDSSHMPRGEWVELYNNDDFDRDLTGWRIQDVGNHLIYIATANTDLATTTIAAHGWLVVYMNHQVLNNSGTETITLIDNNQNLKDVYTYSGNDYCDLEPTPGDDNDNMPTVSCSGVPGNKSYARIPDGTVDWFDPIPTPGGTNVLGEDIVILDDVFLISQEQVNPENNQIPPETQETEELSQPEPEQELESETVILEDTPVMNEQPPVLEEQPTILLENTPIIISSENTNEAPAGDAPSGTSEPEIIQEQQPAIELEVQIIAEEPEIAIVPSDDVNSSGDTAGDN